MFKVTLQEPHYPPVGDQDNLPEGFYDQPLAPVTYVFEESTQMDKVFEFCGVTRESVMDLHRDKYGPCSVRDIDDGFGLIFRYPAHLPSQDKMELLNPIENNFERSCYKVLPDEVDMTAFLLTERFVVICLGTDDDFLFVGYSTRLNDWFVANLHSVATVKDWQAKYLISLFHEFCAIYAIEQCGNAKYPLDAIKELYQLEAFGPENRWTFLELADNFGDFERNSLAWANTPEYIERWLQGEENGLAVPK